MWYLSLRASAWVLRADARLISTSSGHERHRGRAHEKANCRIYRDVFAGVRRMRRGGHRWNGNRPTAIDVLGIAFAFGLASSRWHMGSVRFPVATSIRPLVLACCRRPHDDERFHLLHRCAGPRRIAGAVCFILFLRKIRSGLPGVSPQNGYGPGYLGEYNLVSAFLTSNSSRPFFFLYVISVPPRKARRRPIRRPSHWTLPCRSFISSCIPSLTSRSIRRDLRSGAIVGGAYSRPLWLFWLAPILGAAVAGVHRPLVIS